MHEVIEMLECAMANCDNTKYFPEAIRIVRTQIKEAITMIEEKEGKE